MKKALGYRLKNRLDIPVARYDHHDNYHELAALPYVHNMHVPVQDLAISTPGVDNFLYSASYMYVYVASC